VAVAGVERDQVVEWSHSLYDGMAGIDGVVAPDTSHSPTRPQIEIDIDRDRASALGLDAAAVGDALRIMFGGAEVTRWLDRGEEYEVILQARPEDRSSPADLGNVFLRARGGELVPLTSIVTTREVGTVRELRRVDRLAAVEIGANLRPGFTLGTALEEVERIVEQDLPPAAQIRYLGESLDYVETGSALYLILILVLLLTYLVLAMQFESFLHPAVVMAAAPLALAGGLLTLLAFGLTLNIYSQIAMVLRDSAPAPLATASGTAPRMVAMVVIRMGRSRSPAAASAASRTSWPSSRNWLANSTSRMPFFATSPISSTMAIWL
jgi:multidrug efflux pump